MIKHLRRALSAARSTPQPDPRTRFTSALLGWLLWILGTVALGVALASALYTYAMP